MTPTKIIDRINRLLERLWLFVDAPDMEYEAIPAHLTNAEATQYVHGYDHARTLIRTIMTTTE